MNIKKSIILETKNLKLRFPSLEDIPYIFSATRYEGFNDGMLWEPPTKKEDLIHPYHKGIKAWDENRSYVFTIENKKTKDFLGRIVIRKTAIKHKWNVGFWTHPEHQRKGVMTEGLKIIIKFGFERLGAKTIDASHALWNKGSEKVLKKTE